METNWRKMAFQPGGALASAIAEQWCWLTQRDDLTPFLCSLLGDVFASDALGSVHWLNCSAGQLTEVAVSRARFDAICAENGAKVEEWFKPSLIAQLHAAGKVAKPGEAYMFLTLPIDPKCRYEPDNFRVMPVKAIYMELSDVHQLYAGIPGG